MAVSKILQPQLSCSVLCIMFCTLCSKLIFSVERGVTGSCDVTFCDNDDVCLSLS